MKILKSESPEQLFEGFPMRIVKMSIIFGDAQNWNAQYIAFRKSNEIIKEHISSNVVQAQQKIIGQPDMVCMITSIIFYVSNEDYSKHFNTLMDDKR